MFVNVAKTLSNIVQATTIAGLMKRYNVRSFRDGFQKRQFEQAASGSKQRYVKTYYPHGNQESDRRCRQGAHERQLASHKPGAVQPAHIFGGANG